MLVQTSGKYTTLAKKTPDVNTSTLFLFITLLARYIDILFFYLVIGLKM